MGSVEAASEELADGTTRIVALKRILRTTGSDAPQVEMFLREARLTTLLEHPNVIRSFAYGESSGELFLAMEYVSGEPLSRVLSAARARGEPLPLGVIAYVLAEACEGLHAAHELRGPDGEPLGVVHRDVSPQNVMVGYDGTVKLLDFGVAKIELLDCAARTKTGEVKGKTAYMSPEQAMGEVIDRRSDLYSIGAVLFECVAGVRMWGTGTDLDVLRKLALEAPPKLSDVAPAAPAALAELFDRLVLRDPEKRPGSAHDVAVALRALATDERSRTDAAALRETMATLFAGERERRDHALARAMAAGPTDEANGATGRPGSGESGPVFITHSALPAQGPARRQPGAWATGAAAVLACGLAALAMLHRGPGEASATLPLTAAPLRLPAAKEPRASERASPAPEAHAAPASAPAPAIAREAPPESPAPAAHKALFLAPRHTATPPSVRAPTAPASAAAIASVAPVVTAPPVASGTSRPPDPPDVDPTPF